MLLTIQVSYVMLHSLWNIEIYLTSIFSFPVVIKNHTSFIRIIEIKLFMSFCLRSPSFRVLVVMNNQEAYCYATIFNVFRLFFKGYISPRLCTFLLDLRILLIISWYLRCASKVMFHISLWCTLNVKSLLTGSCNPPKYQIMSIHMFQNFLGFIPYS